ncbi:MAG: TPM domain-containing protein [Leptospiraceae bacterium]|nr:TPM domain-containing protein [Leptospiraceae bacterium]
MKFYSLVLFSFLLTNSIFALDVPFLSGRVIDDVGILSDEIKISIENKLKEHEKQTSNQVVVLIIPSLEGEILEEYSLKVASTWKLGQKGKDNGVLLLIAKNDRKIRIEVGYGLEGTLTDVLCNRIIRNEITPSFKQGNFSLGVERGVDAIVGSIQGTYKGTEEDSSNENNTEDFGGLADASLPIFFRLFFGVMFLLVITPFTLAAAFTPYIGWFLYFFLMPFYATFPVVALGKWGLLLLPIYVVVMFIFKVYLGFTADGKKFLEKYGSKFQNRGSSGGSSGSGWSSGSSGRSSGGGSSSGGGGGSFGGGGSSGSW